MWRMPGAILTLLLVVGACASRLTPYGSRSLSELTDGELIVELEAAARGVGLQINRADYLLATAPDPVYLLTATQTSTSGAINAYIMPSAYGAHVFGTYQQSSTTQYYYTDVNSFQRSMSVLASAIAQWQAARLRERATSALEEAQRRMATRRQAVQALIDGFFARNPDLMAKRNLLAMIAPWVVVQQPDASGEEILDEAGRLARELPRGDGIEGIWFGQFQQVTTLPTGQAATFSDFATVNFLRKEDGSFYGGGYLGSGEEIAVQIALSDDGMVTGAVANLTSAINVTVDGTLVADQMRVEFVGGGVGFDVAGSAILLR